MTKNKSPNQKWAKEKKKEISIDEVQTYNKHMQKKTLAIKTVWTKTAGRFHLNSSH